MTNKAACHQSGCVQVCATDHWPSEEGGRKEAKGKELRIKPQDGGYIGQGTYLKDGPGSHHMPVTEVYLQRDPETLGAVLINKAYSVVTVVVLDTMPGWTGTSNPPIQGLRQR